MKMTKPGTITITPDGIRFNGFEWAASDGIIDIMPKAALEYGIGRLQRAIELNHTEDNTR